MWFFITNMYIVNRNRLSVKCGQSVKAELWRDDNWGRDKTDATRDWEIAASESGADQGSAESVMSAFVDASVTGLHASPAPDVTLAV